MINPLTYTGVYYIMYCIVQNFRGGNFGKFGKTSAIRQYSTQPNSRLTKVANLSYCKFANIFLAKLIKRSIRQSFTPPKFCAIRYIFYSIRYTHIYTRTHTHNLPLVACFCLLVSLSLAGVMGSLTVDSPYVYVCVYVHVDSSHSSTLYTLHENDINCKN